MNKCAFSELENVAISDALTLEARTVPPVVFIFYHEAFRSLA